MQYTSSPVQTNYIQDTIFFAIGDCDASQDTHTFWVAQKHEAGAWGGGELRSFVGWLQRPSKMGMVFYMHGNEMVGALAWIPRSKTVIDQEDSATDTFQEIVLGLRHHIQSIDFDVRTKNAVLRLSADVSFASRHSRTHVVAITNRLQTTRLRVR